MSDRSIPRSRVATSIAACQTDTSAKRRLSSRLVFGRIAPHRLEPSLANMSKVFTSLFVATNLVAIQNGVGRPGVDASHFPTMLKVCHKSCMWCVQQTDLQVRALRWPKSSIPYPSRLSNSRCFSFFTVYFPARGLPGHCVESVPLFLRIQ